MGSRKENQNSLYNVFPAPYSKKKWKYGYDEQHDIIVISKDGTLGQVYEISGIKIGLPEVPKVVHSNATYRDKQYWKRFDYPPALSRIKSIFQWNDMTPDFKEAHISYIEKEFDRRENGFWFMNYGHPTYITGGHYMYLQWSKIDVGYPDFREANRIFFIFWEACLADPRCFGMCYLKIRRSGFSFMSSSMAVNIATLSRNSRIGILSKTGADAKKMFTDKVVPISSNYPFFFKPIQDGMDKPKVELAYRLPASKITRKNMNEVLSDSAPDGLNTTIDWRNTADNSYDGEKLALLVHDESGKWMPPDNILNNWRVTKTTLRIGSKIVGKCMMGSTCNARAKGGDSFKRLYDDSDVKKRNANGQTKSGLYKLFVPMEWNFEGYIDKFGWPVMTAPEGGVQGPDGTKISTGAIEYWENEVSSLKNDSNALNEFYRQFPRTEAHAFRDESRSSLFNLNKIYQQIDYNDGMLMHKNITRGQFVWENGVKDTKVLWQPNNNGRFLVSWIPHPGLQNNVVTRSGKKYPGNEHIGSFGCDPYDISGVVGGGGSNGSLHGLTKFNMVEGAPSNMFFLEYIARPQTAEIFFEDVLMACVFYGMPMLAENNKPRLLYHFKNRGYRMFSMNRPDRQIAAMSKTEIEIGGIPNSSEDVKQSHASAIESYIEKYVGFDTEAIFRDPDECGNMYFNKTLLDWAGFDINNRTKHDASISSGLAIMANQKHLYLPEIKSHKISINFARYNNEGRTSQIVNNG
jgi:hypothetical protein